jgi:hypothetical protein
MRFEIAVHAQGGRMRSDLPQQPALDEKPQIVIDGGERNGWNAAPDRGVNIFRGIVSVGSDDDLIDHLTLVCDRQTVLRGQLTELFMGETHNYRMRIIIKQPGALSSEGEPLAMKLVGPLAGDSPGLQLGLCLVLRLALALEIERHCSADEIL